MTIPTASSYPVDLDSNRNLFQVHDSLRVRLAKEYKPGDKTILVDGEPEIMKRFPPSGIITLTEQCSSPDERALSFFYGSRDLTTFKGLELLPGFKDVAKPKRITDVTQNVMASHHNHLKNAVIAIEQFVGIKGEVAQKPLQGSMEARINFLRKLVLSPRAWFTVNKRIGLVPFTVEFKDLSFRLGTDGTAGPITYHWNFGDNTASSLSIISVISVVPPSVNNVIVRDLDGAIVRKTYSRPGIYDVSLTVRNDFGEDTIILPALINARVAAPDPAVIDFNLRAGQILTKSGLPVGGPYTVPPVIRSVTNSLIDIEVKAGKNPSTGRSYGGEVLDGNNLPIDPIQTYTWSLGDDLLHSSFRTTKASYSIGGVYDLVLRVDTKFGAYRITSHEDAIDIIEKTNLWLWNFPTSGGSMVRSHEYGLLSQTFKIKSGVEYLVAKDDTFLNSAPNATQQKREFNRNNGFTARGTTASGNQGTCLIYWASGRSPVHTPSQEDLRITEYNGFSDVYISRTPILRPWNWASFASASEAFFILGAVTSGIVPNSSPTNQNKATLNLSSLSTTTAALTTANYKNGADELRSNMAAYDAAGSPLHGHMSVYRTAWKGNAGFLLRNDGVGTFFRIKSFYKTESVGAVTFQNIKKLTDMAGPTKLEGQLVPLSSGVFFFNNSGSISAYNDASGVWETGGPGLNSATFRVLQDATVSGFDNADNTLVAASDGDRKAYLSYDYSPRAFIKFNEADLTFSSLGSRPEGTQWQLRVF